MNDSIGTRAGTDGMSAMDNLALPENSEMIGYVEPMIGRVARRDVIGYYGFPIIKAGQTVTPAIAERAQNMSRLFELIEATGDV